MPMRAQHRRRRPQLPSGSEWAEVEEKFARGRTLSRRVSAQAPEMQR